QRNCLGNPVQLGPHREAHRVLFGNAALPGKLCHERCRGVVLDVEWHWPTPRKFGYLQQDSRISGARKRRFLPKRGGHGNLAATWRERFRHLRRLWRLPHLVEDATQAARETKERVAELERRPGNDAIASQLAEHARHLALIEQTLLGVQ